MKLSLAAIALCLTFSAHADDRPSTQAELDSFMLAIKALSPVTWSIFQDVGISYARRCGRNISISGYRQIANNSEASIVAHAILTLHNVTSSSALPTEQQERYASRIDTIQCNRDLE